MELSPKDILEKQFDIKMRGYDRNQVNDYLDVIVANIENKEEVIKDLRQEVATLSERVAYFENLQDALNDSILIAQEAGEQLKQTARKEADLIMYEGERDAKNIVSDAIRTSNEIMTETEALRKQAHTFRQQLQQMVESQLSLINNDAYQDLFNEHESLIMNVMNSVRDSHKTFEEMESDIQKEMESNNSIQETLATEVSTSETSTPEVSIEELVVEDELLAPVETEILETPTAEVSEEPSDDSEATQLEDTEEESESGIYVQGRSMRINLPD